MGEYTFLRVEVDAGIVARILDAVPGVTVVGDGESADEAADERPPVTDEADTSTAAAYSSFTEDETQCGPVVDTVDDDEEPSALRKWGLLGVGVSLVLLGVATVGIWWYRRRNGDDGDLTSAETPPPATDVDRATASGSDDRTSFVESATGAETDETETWGRDEGAAESEESVSGTVLGDRPETTEPKGRTEDRSDVEWAPREASERQHVSDTESEETDDEPSPRAGATEDLDVAPLLGVAFLAVSGAIVRWVQGGTREES